jgi:hypothetical protein
MPPDPLIHRISEATEGGRQLRDLPAWKRDSRHWRGRVLTGRYCHWCDDWDGLPIDETTPEWPCACASDLIAALEKVPTSLPLHARRGEG